VAELTLAEANDGGRFSVSVGDAITIHLSENAAAGYRWSVASLDDTHVAVEGQRYQAAGSAVGSAGTSVWTLRATRPGTTRVALQKSRSWERGKAAAAHFAIELDITG
jgi:predicted secreted protein